MNWPRRATSRPPPPAGICCCWPKARLLRVERQGRHRYHRLASADVARVLEGIMQLAAQTAPTAQRVATGPRDAAMRLARTCYDQPGRPYRRGDG